MAVEYFLAFINTIVEQASGDEWFLFLLVGGISISILALMLWYLKIYIRITRLLLKKGTYLPDF